MWTFDLYCSISSIPFQTLVVKRNEPDPWGEQSALICGILCSITKRLEILYDCTATATVTTLYNVCAGCVITLRATSQSDRGWGAWSTRPSTSRRCATFCRTRRTKKAERSETAIFSGEMREEYSCVRKEHNILATIQYKNSCCRNQ